MKKYIIIAMSVLLALAWYVTLSTWLGNESKYREFLAEAQRLESKGLYLDAISRYEEAKTIKGDTLELAEYIADDYLAMGNYKEYQNHLGRILDTFGPVEADITKLVSFHQKYSSQGTLINCVKELYQLYPDSEAVRKYYNTLKGVYEERHISVERIGDFLGGVAVYELNGKKGMLNEEGDVAISAVYDEIIYNGQDTSSISVKDGKEWYYITSQGYKSKAPDEDYEYLDAEFDGRVLAKKNGKYGYLTGNLHAATEFIYDDATAIYNGFGAVKQNGKWALINKKGELITEYIYDDVARNSFNICSINKIVGVCRDEEWFLINDKGERVGEQTFQGMKAFIGGQPCAVCLDDKWGYMDTGGNLVIACSYEDAGSFANGYAPVCRKGLWGYIDRDNFLAIDYSFAEAGSMTQNGVAPISHGGSWTLIQLVMQEE